MIGLNLIQKAPSDYHPSFFHRLSWSITPETIKQKLINQSKLKNHVSILNDDNHGVIHTKITKEKAFERIKNWLKMFSLHPNYKVKPDQVPRAIFVPWADITQIIAKHHIISDAKIVGVRIYFGLTQELDADCLADLCGSVVPVFEKDGVFVDLLASGNDNDSSIYDFTTPCPQTCDKTSALFNVQIPTI
ncbi:hypothetical protein [Mucilaginibacter jinjuensis]|uniref:Uncharacterized protein n=1 Tax=Mucilaginibacter jinjuensis TaxID=1176721 RepID=A0ABY7TDH1_9SPHI|nr:hypothetical protein [Mucilaginibacter jinjuensis]WCT14418.1 hypothetical protein PQO05_10790 [Mucilaginibacter jinjuensis]